MQGMPTPFGRLGYHAIARGETIEMRIEGGITVPSGGLAVALPVTGVATVNGVPVGVDARGRVIVRAVPATVVVRP